MSHPDIREHHVHRLFSMAAPPMGIRSTAEFEKLIERFGGADWLLEAVASGRLLNEIAMILQCSVRDIHRYVEENVSSIDWANTLRHAAESYMHKAEIILSAHQERAIDATQARAAAKLYTELAQSLDVDRFAAKSVPGSNAAAVAISLNFGDGSSQSLGAVAVTQEVMREQTIDNFVLNASPAPPPTNPAYKIKRNAFRPVIEQLLIDDKWAAAQDGW